MKMRKMTNQFLVPLQEGLGEAQDHLRALADHLVRLVVQSVALPAVHHQVLREAAPLDLLKEDLLEVQKAGPQKVQEEALHDE